MKTKQQELDALYEPYQKCLQCPLGYLGRLNVVFGAGNPESELLIIGEAPGKNEDLKNIPFIGRSGQLLTKILHDLGTSREEIYITNIVKCRPPNNRKPLPLEITTCKTLLLENQIAIIKPKVIVTLGSVALNAMIPNSPKISAMRGIATTIKNITIIPSFHPAYLLRNIAFIDTLKTDLLLALSLCTTKKHV